MIGTIVALLLWFSVIACGLLAGVYFAFSAFIMRALGEIDRAAGIAAMNAINRVILRSAFMPLFVGSTVSSLALAIVALVRWSEAGAATLFGGGVLYVAGMFVVTMVCNVPLNNALIGAAPSGAGGGDDLWMRYLDRWTRWNHVRTIASTGAMLLFSLALVVR